MTNRLWTPWRMEYVVNATPQPGCVLCQKPQETDDAANYVLYRAERCYLILNLFPYNTGHLMVVPYQHTASLTELPAETRADVFELATLATDVIAEVMRPSGFNLGMNLGAAAGAGIASHLHLHVVPRWDGDTNFMPVLADTKVMPETLPQTFAKLRPAILARTG